MATRVRRATNAQAIRQIVRYQQELTGGLNVDENPGTLPTGAFPELTNLQVSGSRLVSIPGELASITHGTDARLVACAGRAYSEDVGGDYLWEISSEDAGAKWDLFVYAVDPEHAVYAWRPSFDLFGGSVVTKDEISALPYMDSLLVVGGGCLLMTWVRSGEILGHKVWFLYTSKMNADVPISPALNPINPDNSLTWTPPSSGEDTVDHLYYLLITLVQQDSAGVVLWESLPLNVVNSSGEKVLVPVTGTSGEPDAWIGATLYLNPAKMTIDHTGWTHFRVYRTLDIGPIAVTNTSFSSESAQSYRLICSRAKGASTTTIQFNVDSDAMLFSDQDILLVNPEIYAGQLRAPMPVGTAGVIAYSDGYLWTADGPTAYHSEAAAWPRFAGYYFTGSTSPILEKSGITGIYASDGYALICTATSVRRVSTQNVLEFGTALGIYGTVFQYTPYVTPDYGVRAERRQACDVVGSEVVLFCSDHQVRIYSGSAMGEPISAGKVSKLLRAVAGTCYSVYSPEGYWQLSWSSTGSGACDTALRLSLGQSGRPWCKVDWGLDHCKPFYLPSAFFALGADGTYSGILRLTELADGAGATTAYSLYSMTSYLDSVDDLPFAITSPAYGGEYDGYLVRHEETTLTVNGSFTAGTFSILADSAADEPFGTRRAYAEQIALVGEQVEAPLSIARTIQNIRFAQVRLTGSDTVRFELTKLMSILSAIDRPYRNRTVLALAPGNADRMRMTPCAGIPASTAPVSGVFTDLTNGTATGVLSSLPGTLSPSVGPMQSNVPATGYLIGQVIRPAAGAYATFGTGLTRGADEAWSVMAGAWVYLPTLCQLLDTDPLCVSHSLFALGDIATLRIRGWDVDSGTYTALVTLVENATGDILAYADLALDDATKSIWVRIEAMLSNDGTNLTAVLGAAYSTSDDTAALAYIETDGTLSDTCPAPSSVIAFGGFARTKNGALVPMEKAVADFIVWDLRIGSIDEATTVAEFKNAGYLSDIRNSRGENYVPGIVLQ